MTINPADSTIFGLLFGAAEMRELFSDRRRFQAMLDVEAALARAEAGLGIIPADAAAAISAAASVDHIRLEPIADSTPIVGYPVVALVKELGRVAGPAASGYVHWGTTTQDILDTALVLQMREGLRLIEEAIAELAGALAEKAVLHRDHVMAGRTHLQHALPVTFGYKCAVWLSPFLRHLERLRELRPRLLMVQFGGAVGTLASLGVRGAEVRASLAAELALGVPAAPWHVARDTIAETAAVLGLVSGSLAKLATDVILLMQTEIAEVSEPRAPGRGGSSTMPQKRNPIASEYILAAARGVHALVPVLLQAQADDHERGTGPWQSEQLALPQIFVLTSGALAHATALARGMIVDTERMRGNLDATRGLIMAEAAMMTLAGRVGRDAAHRLVEAAAMHALAAGGSLADALASDPEAARHLDAEGLAALAAPESYLGEAGTVVDRVVARTREMLALRAPA